MSLFTPASVRSVDYTSPFYGHLDTLFRSTTFPAVVKILKETGRFYCLTWTPETASSAVHPFWDTDCYKSMEAFCYFLIKKDDPTLRKELDEYVEIVKKAQWPDGYLSSYYTVHGPEQRFTNLRDSHELYTIGHLAEFAVAYYELTGSHDLINVCKRFVELMQTTVVAMGAYDGHQELELALMRLYEVTSDQLFLETAGYLLRERGRNDSGGKIFFDHECMARGVDPYRDYREKGNFRLPRDYAYMQAHLPLTEIKEADGHCVRAVYWLTGALHYALATPEKSQDILQKVHELLNDMVKTKMYITGGFGAVAKNEGFGPAYHLPDKRDGGGCYSETCASFAMIVLCERLLRAQLRGRYGDLMETNLMNCVLGAAGSDGVSFYYENPLATTSSNPWPRKKWFKVSCCPPNIIKTWGFLGSAQFATRRNTIAVHLYLGANFSTTVDGGKTSIKLESGFPYAGDVKVLTKSEKPFELALRIPGWSGEKYTSSIEGQEKDGYLYVQIPAGSSEIKLDFPMTTRFMFAHPQTRKDDVAIVRGPLVYCAEGVDNDFDLEGTYISDEASISESTQPDIAGFENVPVLEVPCKVKKSTKDLDVGLYSTKPPAMQDGHKVKLVPYFLRDNRGGDGAMRVWLGWLSH